MITISSKLLKAICEFASKDETRAHLNAVNFECDPGAESTRVNVVAIDGHTMAIANVARIHGDKFAARYVPLADLLIACKVAGASGNISIAFPADHSTEVSAYDKSGKLLTSNVVCLPKCSNPFPSYMNVLPSPGKVESFAINTKYLGRLSGISAALGVANNAANLVASGPMDPARFDIQSPEQGGVNASVVIMPVRYDAAPINWTRH